MLRYAYIINMSPLLDPEPFQMLSVEEPEIIWWSKGTLELCFCSNLGLEAGTKLSNIHPFCVKLSLCFRATTEYTTALMKGSDRQEKDFYARKLCNLITRTIEVIHMHIFRTQKYKLCTGIAKLFKSMKWLRYGHHLPGDPKKSIPLFGVSGETQLFAKKISSVRDRSTLSNIVLWFNLSK